MKRKCSIILIISLVLSIFQGKQVFAANDKLISQYEGDGYSVNFVIEDQWNGGYQATVEIKNNELSTIENWCLEFELNGNIQNIWNAQIIAQEDNMYAIKNVGWNQDIEKDKSVTFGFISNTSFQEFPKEYYIQSEMVLAETDEYSIQYTITSDWGNGFNGNIEIKNESEESIEDWKLEIDFDNQITDIWNAEITENNGKHYVIGNKTYNQNILAGSTVNIGFTCEAGDSQKKLENIQLTKFGAETQEVEDDSGEEEIDTDNASDYVYIDFPVGNTYESVIDDVIFVNAAEDRMKVKWKSSNEDVITNKGEVYRHNKDEKVTITAEIFIDDQIIKKEFELVVMKKINIDVDKLKDYSVEEIEELNVEDEDYYCEINDFGYLQTIYGTFSSIKVTSYEAALYSLYNIKSALGISNPFEELQIYDIYASEEGYTFKFMQMYGGVTVFSNEIAVYADEEGNTSYIRSSYYPFSDVVDLKPKNSYNTIKSKFQFKYPECQIKDMEDTDSKLYLINYYGNVDLVWNYLIYFPKSEGDIGQGKNQILLGTEDAEIKFHYNIDESVSMAKTVSTTGKDLKNKKRKFSILSKKTKILFWSKTKYYLQDASRKIKIYDGKTNFSGENKNLYKVFSKNKNKWNKKCVSAIANMKDIYEFFYDTYHRYSYNCAKEKKKGKVIDVYINANYADNLFWLYDDKILAVGSGTGESNDKWNQLQNNEKSKDANYYFEDISLVVADDLLCHEFGHAVFQTNNKQKYSAEYGHYGVYGIVSEAYADVLACFYDNNWTLGEKAAQNSEPALRDIKNPSITKCASKISNDDNFYVDYTDFSNDKGGVHANSTIVSRMFYLLNKRYGMNIKSLEKVWMYSVKQIGYDINADFWDVYLNLKKSLKKNGFSKYVAGLDKIVAEAGITEAICNMHYTNYTKQKDMELYCNGYFCNELSLEGKIVSADTNLILSDNEELDDVNINVMDKDNEKLTSQNTEGDGSYAVVVPIREKYLLKTKKKGYLDEMMYVSDINEILQTDYYCDTVELIPEEYDGIGNASGRIIDAANANGVGKAELHIRKGINNIYTDPIQKVETDNKGNYSFQNLVAGNYCVEIVPVSNSTYINTHFNIKILGGKSINDQNGVISPDIGKNQIRVVLTWGYKPADLDAHVEYNVSSQKGHVYYSTKTFEYAGEMLCNLDVDDRYHYGPETITIKDQITASYKYYVHNYSNEDTLEGCGAIVRVYLGGKSYPAYTFHVPYGEGRYWTVFEYNTATKRFNVINEINSHII